MRKPSRHRDRSRSSSSSSSASIVSLAWLVAVVILNTVTIVTALPSSQWSQSQVSRQLFDHGQSTMLSKRQNSSSSSSSAATRSQSTSLSQQKANLIKQTLTRTANKSWEMGAHAQALLELDYPSLAVFFSSYVPIPTSPIATSVLDIVDLALSQQEPGSLQIVPDGSAADPASLGVAVVLSNWTNPNGEQTRQRMATAADNQLRALLQDTPRTQDGAISHRVEEVSLWSDFMYMVPPFLAYYGSINSNASLIQQAYDQCRLYRQYLRTPETGLWQHILFGQHPDPGLWATGNAWAAGGMMRVYGTIVNSQDFSNEFESQAKDLADWSLEIVENSFNIGFTNVNNGGRLLRNYLNESDSFGDATSTALLTGVVYRLAQFNQLGTNEQELLQQANQTRQFLYSQINSSNGILSPVVDPLNFDQRLSTNSISPEGQAFVLLMESAFRDWIRMNDEPGQGGVVDSNGNDETSSTTTLFKVEQGLVKRVVLIMLFVASLNWFVL
ncbi:hypothetical protein OIO90_006284 [Microbotryomycetes sp. JL221]|nr:hypothetical protein OIO90_006284 [Microbotryomycetes sp. JL221]